MICSGSLPRLQAAESRNSPVLGHDERDLPELREDSEPLELLKWELEALKIGQDLETRQAFLGEAAWERVQSVRDALAAEIEVKKKRKRGPWKLKDDKPHVPKKIQASDSPLKGKGTEDNPIPATKSLEQSSNAERRRHALMERRAVGFHTDKKPPLPPRYRPVPHTMQSTALPAQKSAKKRASSPSKPRKPSLTNDISEREPLPVVEVMDEEPMEPTPVKPIVIEAIDPVPGEYNVPIFVDGGDYEDPVVIHSVESMYDQSVSENASVMKVVGAPSPHYRASSPLHPAYVLHSMAAKPKWPEELEVTTKNDSESINARHLLTKIYSEDASSSAVSGGHVDLSHMDADELEAEYARLVKEKGLIEDFTMERQASQVNEAEGEDLTERQVNTNGESTVLAQVGSVSSKDKETAPHGDETNGQGPETYTIIPSFDEPKLKPLDKLRQKSMVVEVSSGEQDLQSTDGVKLAGTDIVFPDVEESDDDATDKAVSKAMDDSEAKEYGAVKFPDQPMDAAVDRRNETNEKTIHRNSSIGREPPETLKQCNSRSRSRSEEIVTTSTYDAGEEESFASIEEGYSKSNDHSAAAIELERYSSSRKKNRGKNSKKDRSSYNFPSIERVVAEYFGARKNRLTENGTQGEYKSTIFTNTNPGCCMAFH